MNEKERAERYDAGYLVQFSQEKSVAESDSHFY